MARAQTPGHLRHQWVAHLRAIVVPVSPCPGGRGEVLLARFGLPAALLLSLGLWWVAITGAVRVADWWRGPAVVAEAQREIDRLERVGQ